MAIQLPDHDALSLLDVDVIQHDKPWISTVRHSNGSGSMVQITWDGVAGSVSIRLLEGEEEILSVEREGLDLLSIDQTGSELYLACEFGLGEHSGRLSLSHGGCFKFRDTVLQTS